MKKYIIILALISSISIGYQSSFTFDTLFPMTWHQKGLESSLSVWQILLDSYEKNNEIIPFDKILSQLAYTQFCVKHIEPEIKSLPEDIAYFVMVLKKIKDLVEIIVITEKDKDFIECIKEMVSSIQQQILPML